nr:Chain C, Epstein-Barr nuclear antigen 1 [Human herpesvirus 4 strain B95-8]4PRE_C Chain C, Epstein-Barr nuclear antigen 1 [Human herpesvirus 4 strain B95-8]4PRP_C Chain C, Epstein-Barr nuclear antigen 1 [Human herpesvirus 4 strain B95-8]
HPVGQADYFEY